MADSSFDLQGFLNDPQSQANKPAAMQFLQSKGIVDGSGKPIPGMSKQNPTQSGGGFGGFVKSIISPVATTIARPFQAVAELGGASSEQVDAATKKITGGIVAPVPQNAADVKKDVGRGIETVALGAPGFGAAGAALGLGNSLEQGNDLFSVQTALQTVLGAASGKVLGLLGKPLFNVAGKVVGEVTPQFLKELTAKGAQAITDFAAQHEIVPEPVSKIVSAVGDKANSILNVAKNATKEEVGKIPGVDKIPGIFSGKTAEQILATPESEVYKLSPSERKLYFDTQTQAVADKSAAAEAQVKTDLAQKTTDLQTQAESLQREAAVASRDETIAMRPRTRAALGQQSQEYRRLVDEALAPHADIPVQKSDVASFVDTKFSEDPQKAAAIKAKLGVETTEGAQPTTIGDIYNQTKALGQEVGAAAKKGVRVFTPEEKLTDDAIHTLTDFMSANGVDLSAPREFWAKYAPIRNQLVTEIKPFNVSGTQTKTFANTLTRVAKGTDVNNENFIKAAEDLMGPIGKDTRAAIQKLNANEKATMAAQLDAENAKAQIQLQKKADLENWSATEFKVNQQAEMRKNIFNYLKGVGALVGYGELRRFVPGLP